MTAIEDAQQLIFFNSWLFSDGSRALNACYGKQVLLLQSGQNALYLMLLATIFLNCPLSSLSRMYKNKTKALLNKRIFQRNFKHPLNNLNLRFEYNRKGISKHTDRDCLTFPPSYLFIVAFQFKIQLNGIKSN